MRLALNQQCTYWGSPSSDGYGGFSTAAPQLLDCRWEDRQEEFLDSSGNKQVSQAVVYLDQDVSVGGFLALGDYTASLTSTTTTALPTYTPNTVAQEIRGFQKSPNLKGSKYVRKAWL